MPFESAAQRRYMYAQHPEIAQRWARRYGNKPRRRRRGHEDNGRRNPYHGTTAPRRSSLVRRSSNGNGYG